MATSQAESETLAASFSGENIAKMLRTEGPVVTCVLLRAKPESDTVSVDADGSGGDGGGDTAESETKEELNQELKPEASCSSSPSTTTLSPEELRESKPEGDRKPVLAQLITELPVDTTPKKSMVSQILGGPFTFLGQYEQEGTMVMIRQQPQVEPDDAAAEEGDCNASFPQTVEGMELNPHELQPPLHNHVVYGDILLMRVAPCAEDDDDKDEAKESALDSEQQERNGETDESDEVKSGESKSEENNDTKVAEEDTNIGQGSSNTILSNEEFFLNYTKEEYIQFASRTDIVFVEPKEEEEEDNEQEFDSDEQVADENQDSGSDEEFQLGGSDDEFGSDDEEDCQIGMMNLILAQIIKRFREQHGRGPHTDELLAMRSALAEKLGIQCDAQNGDVLEFARGSESFQLEDVVGGGEEDNEESKAPTTDNTESEQSNKRKAGTSPAKDIGHRNEEPGDGIAEKRVKFSAKNEIKILSIVEEYEEETDEKPQDFQIIREEDSNCDSNAIQDDEASI